jgi:isopentenyl-diphosphate delta-isomerase
MADEILDQVDKDDNVIGTVWKSKAHGNPDIIHREIAFVIFDKQGNVLLQQRSAGKTNDPLAWKLTVAGHVGAGEEPQSAATRELKEELGFVAKPIYFNKTYISQQKFNESRFFYVYYSLVGKLPKLVLNYYEVADAKWVKISDLDEFAKNNSYDLDGWSHKTIIEIARYLKIK